MSKQKFTFVDLFAGIGGFHQAMRFLGGKCIMASEIDVACQETYLANHPGVDLRGDIREIDPSDIPPFDMLCAGFPCQPFSKAGLQKGFQDKSRGNFFFVLMDFLDKHPETKYLILENVRNLADKTENWEVIKSELIKREFVITEHPLILSPSDFGIPQTRQRVYILGIHKSVTNGELRKNGVIKMSSINKLLKKDKRKCSHNAAFSILLPNVSDEYIVPKHIEKALYSWDDFRAITNMGTTGFPVWRSYFGAGKECDDDFFDEINYSSMPYWKQRFVRLNRSLYTTHKKSIDKWLQENEAQTRSKLLQKFEWQCGVDCKSLKDAIIQVRQSGIRAKRSNYFPSLVAMVNTPIVWDKGKNRYRYITPREAANLQSFNKRFKFLGTDYQIYKQLGNSVNVRVLKIIGKALLSYSKEANC